MMNSKAQNNMIADIELAMVTGGQSFLEQMKDVIEQQKKQEENQPFPSMVDGMHKILQRAYDCVMQYQEQNGVILDDQAAEKRFWEHVTGALGEE